MVIVSFKSALFHTFKLQLIHLNYLLSNVFCIFTSRFKNGHEIHEDARIKIKRDSQRIENYYLTLNLAKSEDAGTYEVKATNFIGETTSSCKVLVLSKCVLKTEFIVHFIFLEMNRILFFLSRYQQDYY